MFKTFLQRVFPAEWQFNPCNTIFYTLLCKRFSIKNKATMACIGDYMPSKHEKVGGTAYRNLGICPFPVADRIPLEERAGGLRTKTGLFTATGFSTCVTPTKTRPSCLL